MCPGHEVPGTVKTTPMCKIITEIIAKATTDALNVVKMLDYCKYESMLRVCLASKAGLVFPDDYIIRDSYEATFKD